ncbi:hypothetical protein EVAR_7050_1 [Eumeta japonica]|uniref:Uncharacterized protein n=1 Tax=Eumeta variegata TaxID=151549 RepID=A0A4C1SA66_EUMVA|nr:hypothetical protein EVAR_7050_1 [Eumeta japonica]
MIYANGRYTCAHCRLTRADRSCAARALRTYGKSPAEAHAARATSRAGGPLCVSRRIAEKGDERVQKAKFSDVISKRPLGFSRLRGGEVYAGRAFDQSFPKVVPYRTLLHLQI